MLTPERSREIRARLGLSQRRAAANAGVSRSYLNQFECGRWNPNAEFVNKLVQFYDRLDSETVQDDVSELENARWDFHLHNRPRDNGSDANDTGTEASGPPITTTLVGLGLIGGILAVTGNLPIALSAIRRITAIALSTRPSQ